jgi:hypothetical protein
MLYNDQFEPQDEAAAGFPVEEVPEPFCRKLFESAGRMPLAERFTLKSQGVVVRAFWTADRMFRVTSEGAVTPAPSSGPGTELKKLLALGGINATPLCSCNAMAAEMNRLGPDWCLENEDKILAVMEQEAKRRKLPFIRLAAQGLIRLAVSRSRN